MKFDCCRYLEKVDTGIYSCRICGCKFYSIRFRIKKDYIERQWGHSVFLIH